jgi:hypothetical protein
MTEKQNAVDADPTLGAEDDADESDPSDAAFNALLSELATAPDVRPERPLGAGERVGEYQIVAVIGRGAFGIVYRAVHPVLQNEVAIKVLGSVHANDPGMAARFVEEARAIYRIKHPNIVEVFGFGELPNGQMYYAMELLSGSTLSAWLAEHGALEPAVALQVLTQVAEALDAAHGHGVLHRDLKPENIFLVGEPRAGDVRAKLLDFGVAKLLGEGSVLRTRAGMIIGTPAYMSPEQCGGETVDEKSDIYSLGVIAHELFTGVRPFPGQSIRETMAKHMFESPKPASSVRAGLPSALDQPLLRMLDKQPQARPKSARAAVAALTESLTPGARARAVRARRGRVLVPLLSLLAALSLAAWFVPRFKLDKIEPGSRAVQAQRVAPTQPVRPEASARPRPAPAVEIEAAAPVAAPAATVHESARPAVAPNDGFVPAKRTRSGDARPAKRARGELQF